jgi:hypothetical protein
LCLRRIAGVAVKYWDRAQLSLHPFSSQTTLRYFHVVSSNKKFSWTKFGTFNELTSDFVWNWSNLLQKLSVILCALYGKYGSHLQHSHKMTSEMLWDMEGPYWTMCSLRWKLL